MTENQYIAELESLLSRLPLEEQQDIVQDIREYFVDGREDGKSDDEIAVSLGSPGSIANELVASYPEPAEVVQPNASTEIITITDDSFKDIAIDVQHGALLLFPSEDHVTTVELTGSNDKLKLSAEVKGNALVVKLKSLRPRFMMFSFSMKSVILKVSIPKKLYDEISLKTDNGRICAEKLLSQSLRVNSDNGRIQLSEVATRVLESKTDNGRIEVTNTQSDRIIAKTDNGRIEMRHVEADGIAVETDNGRIELAHVNGNIVGETDNGRITLLTNSLDRNIDMQTDNGSILIQTEEKPGNVSIQTKTAHGKVDVFGENNSRTVFGTGDHKIRLRSDNGRITVQ
ncbi:DUF4097 family beta strand repeat-containing protein [Sporosarcina jeotgali]|uniref:DUF4097 family beta strand repeat-containing protein n=1 Tax=Sporosarcina jeotgali TaxID=3020056 RepID=A0ABZ0KZM7_9BACL|nr:DUF4097 family beta strand repeat-containing protein [Sporosarcina sp. B2O-1]WOV85680.1 DUF4097 family beta strand repeat-containing protein [Sporosarcina sp. B2O-1]